MKQLMNILSIAILTMFPLASHALQVSVQTSSSNVFALGFEANGQRYGSIGHSYTTNNAPLGGTYIFGVRINGLLGKDVRCNQRGKEVFKLQKNTSAILNYNGTSCAVSVSSR